VICFQGNSVCCYVHGFHPYFYVPAPPNFTEKNLPDFRIALNQAVLTDLKNNKDNVGQAILDVALENKSSIYGFQVSFNSLRNFNRPTVSKVLLLISS
jgi:DNA polymerase delta subunit 1